MGGTGEVFGPPPLQLAIKIHRAHDFRPETVGQAKLKDALDPKNGWPTVSNRRL